MRFAAYTMHARAFYEHFGFIPLPDSATRLFLPMSTIKHLFSHTVPS